MSDIHKPFTAYCPKWIDFLNQFVMVYEQNTKKKEKKKHFSKFVIKENSFEENYYLFLLIFCFSMWISFSILLQKNNNVRGFWGLRWCSRRSCFCHWVITTKTQSFNTSIFQYLFAFYLYGLLESQWFMDMVLFLLYLLFT